MLPLIGACSGDETAGTGYAPASELASFCARLPRPAWQAYDRHPAGTDWFEVYEIEPGIFAIYEPYQWQEVISWLITGPDSALLFDTGNGIGNIRAIVDELTDKPVGVLNSHSHYDHIGGNYQFDQILSTQTPFSLSRSEGLSNAELAKEVSPDALCRPLPDGVTPDSHRTRPYEITTHVTDGDIIDLGNRKLEVLQIPGHTPDSIALLDRESGFLWSGDSFYEGPIWLFAPETDLDAYRESVERLAALAPDLEAVFPAHNTPRAAPQMLVQLEAALGAVLAGQAEGLEVGENQREFASDGFSLLLRKDLLQDGK